VSGVIGNYGNLNHGIWVQEFTGPTGSQATPVPTIFPRTWNDVFYTDVIGYARPGTRISLDGNPPSTYAYMYPEPEDPYEFEDTEEPEPDPDDPDPDPEPEPEPPPLPNRLLSSEPGPTANDGWVFILGRASISAIGDWAHRIDLANAWNEWNAWVDRIAEEGWDEVGPYDGPYAGGLNDSLVERASYAWQHTYIHPTSIGTHPKPRVRLWGWIDTVDSDPDLGGAGTSPGVLTRRGIATYGLEPHLYDESTSFFDEDRPYMSARFTAGLDEYGEAVRELAPGTSSHLEWFVPTVEEPWLDGGTITPVEPSPFGQLVNAELRLPTIRTSVTYFGIFNRWLYTYRFANEGAPIYVRFRNLLTDGRGPWRFVTTVPTGPFQRSSMEGPDD
jgi:hypothetical protein